MQTARAQAERTVADIAAALDGQRSGGGWMARCPAHDDRTPSLSITDGDGRILLHCHAGCTQDAVIAALRDRGLWPAAGTALMVTRPHAPASEASANTATARRIWRQTQPAARTVVEQYLRSRGIEIETIPGTLRYHPALRHDGRQTLPAMVAAVQDLTGAVVAIHRTYLRPDGAGKGNVDRPKRMLGPTKGNAVRLTEAGECLVIAEGIETGLCVRVATELPTWAALSAPGIASLQLPALPLASAVIIATDADDDGASMRAARQAAARWQAEGRSVRIAPSAAGTDYADVLREHGAERVRELIEAAEEVKVMDTTDSGTGARPRPPSQATVIYDLAIEAGVELFHDGDDAYAICPLSSCRATYAVRSRAYRLYLTRLYYERTHKAPSAEALPGALGLCEAGGRYDGEECHVHTRIGEQDGSIYLDLCDTAWRAVEITPAGWRVVSDPPVRFRRARGMLALPDPQRGGHLDELRTLVNIGNDDDYLLVRSWLIGALRPRGPYPVLGIHGEQGSAKSTLSRLLRDLIDPNAAGLRAEPRDAHDLIIAATNGWIIALDNVSHLPAWLSDALCRLATGGGFATRELYSDKEEVLFEAQRPALLNGITEVATHADLLDRSILIEAPVIADNKRRTETDLMRAFGAVRPQLLGALLDHVVTALHKVENVRLDRLPRMADFAVWTVAADPGGGETFLTAYNANRAGANDAALEASEIARHVFAFIGFNGQWTGTAQELLTVLNARVDEKEQRQPHWPKTPRALRAALTRIASNLRAAGLSVDFLPRSGRQRPITIRRCEDVVEAAQPSQPSQPSSTAKTLPVRGDGASDGDGGAVATVTPTVTKKVSKEAANDAGDGGDGLLQPLLPVDEERF